MKSLTTDNRKNRTRRRFLKGAVAGTAGAAAAVAMPNVSRAQTVVLKMQGSWGAGDIINDYAKQYVEIVNAMGGGRLRIDYLNAGAVVKPFEVQDAVHKGVLDAGHLVPAYWYGKNRAASLFGTGPCFGWNPHQLLSWVNNGPGKKLYEDLTQNVLKLNVVGWFLMPMPTQPFGWFKKEPKGPDDIRNLKYRTVGLSTNVAQAMGFKVTQLPGGEIMPAMEKGVIEAFEYNNPTSDRRFGAADVAKIYMMSSYHQTSELLEVEVNKTKFDSLAKEQQAILRHATEAASSQNLWTAYEYYPKDLQALKKDGVTVRRTPTSILEAQLKAWDKVVEQYSKEEYFKKVVDNQRAWAKDVAYFELLNAHDTKLAYNHYFGKEQPLGF